jgi:glycosyltransferase involved in cell wall biosynthesis
MDENHKKKAWELLIEKAQYVDAFLPVSNYYAEFMRSRMQIPSNRLHVVYPGVDKNMFEPGTLSFDPPVLGYLSRMAQASGLDRLVDAFIQLKNSPGLQKLKLLAAGGLSGDDKKFIKILKNKLLERGFLEDTEFYYDYSIQSYIQFLKSISVLSVPTDRGGAFGLYIIEALASGIPVVQPGTWAFPEIINLTGGGLLYKPDEEGSLVYSLASLLNDQDRARKLGMQGRKGIEKYFSLENIATKTAEIYKKVTGLH